MGKYDFDEMTCRRGTSCVKWDANSPCGPISEDVIPLWVADMDFKAAPAIFEAVKKRAEHGVFGYTIVEEDYYEAVISWFRRRHNWTIRREEILYTTGVVPAMSVAIKALTMPGEKVLILSPDYNCFFSSVRNNGCEVLETPLRRVGDTFEVDFEDFEAKCADEKTTLFLLCNPHNPCGRVPHRAAGRSIAPLRRRSRGNRRLRVCPLGAGCCGYRRWSRRGDDGAPVRCTCGRSR